MQDMNVLKNKYLSLYGFDGISEEQLDLIERELDVKLPLDFREISSYYCGGIIGGHGIHSFLFSDPTNLINETLRIRNAVDLPNGFVVLGEHSESIILLDTENKPVVLWVDSVEIDKLHTQNFSSKPDTWDNFSDFFNEILENEEEERKY